MLLRLIAIFLISFSAYANELTARIVDVGPGLCVVIKAPGGNMVYDTGLWNSNKCRDGVNDLLGAGSVIDLMVVRHSDADHYGGAEKILQQHTVKHIIRTGLIRSKPTWKSFNTAIGNEVIKDGASVTNLATKPISPGDTFKLGEVDIAFVYGLHEWTQSQLPDAEMRNVISIVLKVDYAGKSILLPGDTIGRSINDPVDTCKEAEKEMVENKNNVFIDSDVIIAPHHGGDNASSKCFIEAVNPEYVIFSAGHAHQHPWRAPAERYLNSGVDISKIFRTDFGDVAGPKE